MNKKIDPVRVALSIFILGDLSVSQIFIFLELSFPRRLKRKTFATVTLQITGKN